MFYPYISHISPILELYCKNINQYCFVFVLIKKKKPFLTYRRKTLKYFYTCIINNLKLLLKSPQNLLCQHAGRRVQSRASKFVSRYRDYK